MIMNPNPEKPIIISIAMATFNGEKYLKDQLQSFINQTRPPDELVVCDDHSNDKTIDILQDFSATAPFSVKVVCNELNLGYTKNFEKALSLCTGDFIFISDQDDVWFPEKISSQTCYLQEHPECLVVVCNMQICDRHMMPSRKTLLGNILDLGEKKTTLIAGCATALRRQFLDLFQPVPDPQIGHDNWIGWLSNTLEVKHIIEQPLQLYRRHDKNTSDSIVNRPSRIPTLGLALSYGLRSSLDGWAIEMSNIQNTRNRISERPEVIKALGLGHHVPPAFARFDKRTKNLEDRMVLVSHPRITRWAFVILFWMKGGYQHFAGWKSVLKDMVRP